MYYFFFNDTATTEIYTLSLHDALPICRQVRPNAMERPRRHALGQVDSRCERHGFRCPDVDEEKRHNAAGALPPAKDRKSTRLNSSHANISYAVFCLKKKKTSLNVRIR